jgi:hypothetical protein
MDIITETSLLVVKRFYRKPQNLSTTLYVHPRNVLAYKYYQVHTVYHEGTSPNYNWEYNAVGSGK